MYALHQNTASSSKSTPANQPNWTPEENKLFEKALVEIPEENPDRWAKIASQIPNKSPEDIRIHYIALIRDIALIDSGEFDPLRCDEEEEYSGERLPEQNPARRRGVPWSEEEHRRFLEGLERFGRGDWRNISRWAVRTRTPTQVASHAQKFYLRQIVRKESKRKSIHDITT